MKFPTLCVLSYERPKFIYESLDSLRRNTSIPYELIIHDDGSYGHEVIQSDYFPPWNLESILDDQVRSGATVIRNMPGWNQGQGVALNRMFSMAKGDPIIKLDADLTYKEGWLEKVNDIFLQNDRNSGGVGAPEDDHLGLLGLLHYYHEPVDSRETEIRSYPEWSVHTHILGSGFAVSRKCWKDLGPFSEYSDAFAEDWEFQKKVTDSELWACGLPKEDLVENFGMGIGRSVVVEAEGKVKSIHKTPYIRNLSDQA